MNFPRVICQGQAILILRRNGYAAGSRSNLRIDGKYMPVREYRSDKPQETFLVGRENSAVTGPKGSNRSDHNGVMTTEKLLEYIKKTFSTKLQ
ncbi:MAG: hypothetical protein V1731_02850 [Candidatus Aenigmatarchaeota archaeon]